MMPGFFASGAGGATPPADSHAYWRINITQSATLGIAYSSISGLEFRATPGGADQCSGGTAIADSYYGAGYEPENAFDHDTSTEWASAIGLPHYIGYQFAAPVSVAQVAVIATDAAYGSKSEAPGIFTIEYSDNGSSWTTAASPATQGSWGDSEVRLFSVP